MTITIKDLAGASITLAKINQDAYSGEFFKRVSNTEYRVKVRHSQEKLSPGSRPMARHNVEVSVTQFQTDGTPPIQRVAYYVLRQPMSEADATFVDFSENLALFLTEDNIEKVIGWETELDGVP
jgi:hypothetical protein